MNLQPEHIPQLLAAACVGLVFAAIALDFLYFNRRSGVRAGRRSIVATGSMVGFFLVYYLVLVRKWGVVGGGQPNPTLLWVGFAMVALGATVNILGRFTLGRNWANHIKIYHDHRVVTTGVYKFIRHPLYASLMLMLLGGGVMYRNALCVLLTAGVFIPFMAYRAWQEEVLLTQQLPEYAAYQRKTGMFMPKLWR